MLQIIIPKREYLDETTNMFVSVKSQTLCLEHSLISVSKWESKTNKPFLSSMEKMTPDEFMEYIKCMTITQNVDPFVYNGLTIQNIKDIQDYIGSSMTATTFRDDKTKPSRKVITSELIYYWMTAFNIPFECEKWHLNRLFTLIRICSIKNDPKGNKMSKNAIHAQNRALNNARRKK